MNTINFFSEVPDFRLNRRKLHLLSDILMLSLCAMICGADEFEDIAQYGHEKEEFLKTFLSLPNGIPSHDTINRVFRLMDTEKFEKCLINFSKEIKAFIQVNDVASHQINIDGKVLRGTAKSGKKKSGLCLVSAFVSGQGLSLGQVAVDSKSNEKTAIPLLIEKLDIKNAIVSIDAIACSTSVASQIIDKGGDYLLALKRNQKTIYEQVEDYFEKNKTKLHKDLWEDFGSGRIEKRTCYLCQDLTFLESLADWKGIKTVIMIEATREKDGKIENNIRFYLSSADGTSYSFNRNVRGHWSIENNLHWQLDVTFREDQSRIRKDNAPENMSTLRKITLQLLNLMPEKKSVKSKRKIAGWNDEYLISILQKLPN